MEKKSVLQSGVLSQGSSLRRNSITEPHIPL
jgi:hypothetical protein